MSSLNSVTLIGNLGRNPEIRATQSGQRIANLAVATSERWKDKGTGEQREATEWHRVVIFNERLVDIAERYCSKGDRIAIHGAQLKTRKWTDQSGAEKYTTEVVLSGFRGDLILLGDRKGDGVSDQGRRVQQAYTPKQAEPVDEELDDEIPF